MDGAIDDLLVIAAAPRAGDGFRSPAETLQIVRSRVASALHYDQVAVRLLDADADGADRDDPDWSQVLEAGESGLATVVEEARERPGLHRLTADWNVRPWRTAVFAPIITRGRFTGVLAGFHTEPHEPSGHDVDMLTTAARIAGIALDVAVVAARHGVEAGEPARHSPGEDLARLDSRQESMSRLVMEPGGDSVHAVCDVLAAEFDTSVLVWDTVESKTRAFSGDAGFRSRITELLRARDPARLRQLAAGSALDSATVYPVGRDRTVGLLLVDGAVERTALARGVVRHAVALLAFDLESERADRTARNVARPSILHALISGRLSARQAHDVGTFVDATGQRLRIGFLRVSDDATATATSHRLNFSARTRGCLAAAAEKDCVLLLVEDAEPIKLRAMILSLVSSISPDAWSLGVSEPFTELADAHDALDQAQVALASAADRQIALHDEIGPTVALLKHLPPGAAAAFVEEMLRPLVEYDRQRNGALVETLGAYLRHRGSLRKAAEELFVHSNTVQLRLARAAQLIGVDLRDLRQLGVLSLAYAWRGPQPDRKPEPDRQ